MPVLEILAAHYGAVGAEKDMVDVTELVKAKVWPSKEGISLMVSPSNIGVKDPAPQSKKVLNVKYVIDGGTETMVSTPDSATFAVTVPNTTPTSSLGKVGNLYGLLWNSILVAGGVFILAISTTFAYQLGLDGYASWILLVLVAFMLPYVGIGGIVLIVFIHAAFSRSFVAFKPPSMFQNSVSAVK